MISLAHLWQTVFLSEQWTCLMSSVTLTALTYVYSTKAIRQQSTNHLIPIVTNLDFWVN